MPPARAEEGGGGQTDRQGGTEGGMVLPGVRVTGWEVASALTLSVCVLAWQMDGDPVHSPPSPC